MLNISKSVGENAVNLSADVKLVQRLINQNIHLLKNVAKLKVDGQSGKLTKTAIRAYQTQVVKLRMPDGRVDPNGKTLKSLKLDFGHSGHGRDSISQGAHYPRQQNVGAPGLPSRWCRRV